MQKKLKALIEKSWMLVEADDTGTDLAEAQVDLHHCVVCLVTDKATG